SDLGFSPEMTPSPTLRGNKLNPAVLKTTQLDSLLGARAQGRITSPGLNNDIVLTAVHNGDALNDVHVILTTGGTAGSEAVTYDDSNPTNKTLTVQIQAGVSTANQVAAAITTDGHFNAVADYHDQTDSTLAGTNPVQAANFGSITS